MTPPRRILILGYAAIGDLIFFLPVLESLRKSFPQARLTFVANAYPTTKELLPATGLVDEIWLCDWRVDERGPINRRIAQAGFDWAVLTASSPAHYFFSALRTIPVRAGHLARLEGAPWSRFKRGWVTGEFVRRFLINRPVCIEPEHSLRRNLRLLDALGVSHDAAPKARLPVSKEHRRRAEEVLGAKKNRRIGVHLGAPNNQYDKMWAPERFGALCSAWAREDLEFVLLGGPEEQASAAAARAVFGGFKDAAGRLGLLETFAAIETCDLFLSNDTGLAKAAMAAGVPTATWWGPSDPAEYGSVWDKERHLDVRTGIACSPCSRMGMARLGRLNYLSCGHHDCLKKLDVDAARRLIERKHPWLAGAGAKI